MIDYAAWAEKTVPVTGLLLDAQNPRIPTTATPLGQRELIAELVQHDKVYELARDIAEQGYSPVESLVGVVEDGKSIVLEGNRRLAALKVLISPDSAPEPVVKKFRHLAVSVPLEAIKRVKVFFAPTREAAAPLILNKHTREQVERWSPIMQAKFYRSLARAGVTAQELARRYGGTPGDIARFLRTDEMYEIACAMDLPSEVREVVQNPRRFPTAVLERLLDIPKAREVLGVDFDEQGAVHGKVQRDEFRKGYARILADIANKVIDTRKLNTADDAEKYLKGLGADTPNLRRRGHFTAEDLKSPAAPVETPSATAPTAARPKAGRVSSRLLPSSVKCRIANPRIRQIFAELQKLKPVERYPNACAAMLRILLELSMGNYLDRTGKIAPLLEKAKKENKPRDWYPTWKQMLRAILDDTDVTIAPLARKVLNGLASDKDSPLDGYVHNRFVTADPNDLRNKASAMEGMLKFLLDDTAWLKKPGAAKK